MTIDFMKGFEVMNMVCDILDESIDSEQTVEVVAADIVFRVFAKLGIEVGAPTNEALFDFLGMMIEDMD